MNETTLSTLSTFPETQSQAIDFAEKLTGEVLAGNKDPLKIDIQLKILSDMFSKIRENIKELALKEAEKYGQKTVEINGAKVTLTGKTTYDYKSCGWDKYNTVIKQKEDYEKMLKTLTSVMADPETGEEILPPAKKYSPYLKIEL
jgi:hypothetical protein